MGADEMARMSATGLAGCTVAFVDYLKEMPFFVQEVLPRLERLGCMQEGLPRRQRSEGKLDVGIL